MTKLSVNINKIATLRNARGGDAPNVVKAAQDIQDFGAQGITIHPRPDERHIRYQDAYDLKPAVHTEYNIEGNPIPKFVEMVCTIKPTQVTLVPDGPDAITSDAGWDPIRHQEFLIEVIQQFKAEGIRTSIFLDPRPEWVAAARDTGADRIELYTEAYAKGYSASPEQALAPYFETAEAAIAAGLGINAGHDLSLENVGYFAEHIPQLKEVSIGHALICEALYLGLENVVPLYLQKLQ